MSILDKLSEKFVKPLPQVPAGMYHGTGESNDGQPLKYHLRIEPDGTGLLIINAHAILHLNQTGTEYAYHLVKHDSPELMVEEMTARYKVAGETIRQDYAAFTEKILSMLNTPDLDPQIYLDFERQTPYAERLSAPYRLDCALTYRQSCGTDTPETPEDRVTRELTGDEWKVILEKAWSVGIPHVIFTGGDPVLRDDLAILVGYAQQLGQVTGVNTTCQILHDLSLIEPAMASGLDHLVVCVDELDEGMTAALRHLLVHDLQLTVHLTLVAGAEERTWQLIDQLKQLGVQTLSLSTTSEALEPQVKAMQQHAHELNLNVVWDIPVPYSRFNPVALEYEGQTYTDGAANAWLYVEPDGDVLPAQGINTRLGNILNDPWEVIWENAGKHFNAAR